MRSCAIEPLQGVELRSGHRVGLTVSFRARRQTHTPGQEPSSAKGGILVPELRRRGLKIIPAIL